MRVFLSVMRSGLDQAALAAAGARMLDREARDAIEAFARAALRSRACRAHRGQQGILEPELSLTEATLVPRPESETLGPGGARRHRCAGPARASAPDRRSRHRERCAPSRAHARIAGRVRQSEPTRARARSWLARAQRAAARRDAGGVHRLRHGCRALRTVRSRSCPIRCTSDPAISMRSPPRCAISIRARRSTAVPTGSTAFARLPPQCPRCSPPDGVLVVELGAGQAPAVATLFAAAGLAPWPPRTDLHGVRSRAACDKTAAKPGMSGRHCLWENRSKKALGISAGTD